MSVRLDPILTKLLRAEVRRQQETLSLIPSENLASEAILNIQSSVLTNKYAEGYPGARYYEGNEVVDDIERLAIRRAKKLFGAQHANVQPHAGAIANLAVYQALLKPGDTILGMDLRSGGHLTHGHSRNISGRLYHVLQYGCDEQGYLDYRQLSALAKKHRPKLIVSGASAYPRQIDFARIGRIAKRVGALHLADMAHIAGLVAAKLHPSPVPHADVVTFTTHKTLRGPRGAIILCRRQFAAAIDQAVMPGIQGGPFEQIIAAKAQALAEAAGPSFRAYQRRVVQNASAMAAQLMKRGFTIATGGTDNHLLLIDLRAISLTGAIAAQRLAAIGLVSNKNLIPNDPRSPLDPSGLRLGSPSITSRGLGRRESIEVANIIADSLLQSPTPKRKKELRTRVQKLARRFPIYRGRTV